MIKTLSGRDLIDAGLLQGKWFRDALDAGNRVLRDGGSREAALAVAMTATCSETTAERTRRYRYSHEYPG